MIDRAYAPARTAVAIKPRLSLSQVLQHQPRVHSPFLGLGPARRFPIMVYLVRFLIGLPSQYPRPCLPCLFPLIHPFRHRLRALHLGST